MGIDPRFISCLFAPGDLLEVRLLPRGQQHHLPAQEIAKLNEMLTKSNANGENIYVSANPRNNRGGKASDVALARCVFADMDGTNPEDANKAIKKANLPDPSCQVASGHGVHLYWRLTQAITDFAHWSKCQKSIIARLQSDPVIFDPPRIMRLPTYVNHKPPSAMCHIIDVDQDRRYDPELFLTQESGTHQINHQEIAQFGLKKALNKSSPGNRNNIGLWLACQLRDAKFG